MGRRGTRGGVGEGEELLDLNLPEVAELVAQVLRLLEDRDARGQADVLGRIHEASRSGRSLPAVVLSRLAGRGVEEEDVAGTRNVVSKLRDSLRRLREGPLAASTIRLDIPRGESYRLEARRIPARSGESSALPVRSSEEPLPEAPVRSTEPLVPVWGSLLNRSRLGAALLVAVTITGIGAVLSPSLRVRATPEASGPPVVFQPSGAGVAVLNPRGEELSRWSDMVNSFLPVRAGIPEEGFAGTIRGLALQPERWPHVGAAVATCAYSIPCTCRVIYATGDDATIVSDTALPLLRGNQAGCEQLHEAGGNAFDQDFYLTALETTEFNGDAGDREVLAGIASTAQFASEIVVLNPLSRNPVLLDYWNMGRVAALPLADLDDDRREEILVYGVSNSTQSAMATILKSRDFPAGSRARSPQGRRSILLEEVASLPERGLSLTFPPSVLAGAGSDPEARADQVLRTELIGAVWDATRDELSIDVADTARDPRTGDPLRYEVHVDFARERVWVTLARSHDVYLRELLRRIRAHEIVDRWGVLETERLVAFEEDLAAGITFWCDREAEAGWRPLDPVRYARLARAH